MLNYKQKLNSGKFSATVRSNDQMGGNFFRLRLEVREKGHLLVSQFKPGQFVQLNVSNLKPPTVEKIPAELRDVSRRDVLLRRPFTFCNVEKHKDKSFCDLLYKVVGPSTLRMTTLSGEDKVSIIGPLGNGFRPPVGVKKVILLAGGMGAAPLLLAGKYLTENYSDIEIIAFAGAKTAEELPFEGTLDNISQNLGYALAEFARYGIESQVATDDGSKGFRGTVLESFQQWRDTQSGKDFAIYACGPEQMLAKVSEIAKREEIPCQVSLERRMACGFGVCQSCVVKCRAENSAETVNKLCCKDGPVFDSREVIFNPDVNTGLGK